MFIDFRKAFDTINRKDMLETIKDQEVYGKIIRILSNMYQKSKACINFDRKGPLLSILKGVKEDTKNDNRVAKESEKVELKINIHKIKPTRSNICKT